MSRTAFLVTGALAVATLGFQMSAAHADHSWGNYHWRSTQASSLVLGDNLGPNWKGTDELDHNSDWCVAEPRFSYLEAARCDWHYSDVLSISIAPGTTNRKNCKATDGRIEVCSERYGNNGWLGMAQIWTSGDHIIKAVAKLNDFYLDMSAYDQPKWRFFVMCHEVGHTLGLGHQDVDHYNTNVGTCMDYTLDPDSEPSNRYPGENETAHDFTQLSAIYSHTDEQETAGGPGKGNGRGNGKVVSVTGFEFATYVRDDPDDWGTAVAFTSKGQPRLFVKDLGEGEKRITHVLWTEDARAGAHFPHQH
jgi:hypothetical protein